MKRMTGKWAILWALLCSPVLADTVVLRDGSILRGKVTGQDPSVIILEIEGEAKVIPKASVRLFREDEDGLAFYKERLAEENARHEKRQADLNEALGRFAFPDGLLIQVAAGQGRHRSAIHEVIEADRIKDNVMNRGSTASFNANYISEADRGVQGSLQLRRSRWFVEAGGSSYSSKLSYQTYGLPPVTSLILPTTATVDQIGFISVSPIEKQDAYGIAAFEPVTLSAAWRWYLFAGASGQHQRATAEGPIAASVRLGSFLQTSGIYIDNVNFTGAAAGHRLGLDVRFRMQGGTEIQLRGFGSEMHGWTKGRGTVLSTTSYANLVQDGRLRVRSYAVQTALFFPLGGRVRLILGGYAENYRQTLSYRTDMEYPTYLNPARIEFAKLLLRLYDKPTHAGRVDRIFAGTEFRI